MKSYKNHPKKKAMKPTNAKLSSLLTPLILACLALCQTAQAVGPDTDGTIPGANNGEGIGVLVNRTGGVWNTGTGFEALSQLTAGNQNTATGLRALFSDTNGGFNTATGVLSLFSNTSGFFNSATGAYSLANNTDGSYNTANGYGALYFNTEGEENTATGFGALYKNTTGSFNTANGDLALNRNTTGDFNTANGLQALFNNTTGSNNTATGFAALVSNTNGNFNTATGGGALFSNTSGDQNTATGFGALVSNSTGDYNTATGYQALAANTAGFRNTAIGRSALISTTGSNNVALGDGAGFNATTGSNNVYIGADVVGVAGETSACYIKSIFGQTSVNGIPVLINSDRKLGTTTSSKRFKEDIKPMDKASEALLALKPVTFHYKKEIDPQGIPQFGLVAEEVEQVNPDLVVRDEEGKTYSVRYDQVNAMLLNEFLKEHKKVQNLEATVAQLAAQFKEQTTQIQKVSAQLAAASPSRGGLEAKNPGPQMASLSAVVRPAPGRRREQSVSELQSIQLNDPNLNK
jgi:hypothetical protein